MFQKVQPCSANEVSKVGERARGMGHEETYDLDGLAEDDLGFLDIGGTIERAEALRVNVVARVSLARWGELGGETDHGTEAGTGEGDAVEGDAGRHCSFVFRSGWEEEESDRGSASSLSPRDVEAASTLKKPLNASLNGAR